MAILAISLAGCQAASAGLQPQQDTVHPFSQTQRIEAIDANLAELNSKVDRTNDLLGQLIEQAKLSAGQQCDLLKAVAPVSTPVPPEPPRAAVMEKEVTDPNAEEGTIRTNDGKQWFLSDFIGQYYRRPWSHPGTIDDHLADVHRVNLTEQFSTGLKEKLHAAIHEYESGSRAAPAARASEIAQNCPNGQCPIRSKSVTVTTPDSIRSRSSAVYQSATPVQSYQYSQPTYYSTRRVYSSCRCNGRRCRF
jgi:hypothetical protein